MLQRPARSPFNSSRRLPGGARRSSICSAALRPSSLRFATFRTCCQGHLRLTLPVRKRRSVSGSLKLRIISRYVLHNGPGVKLPHTRSLVKLTPAVSTGTNDINCLEGLVRSPPEFRNSRRGRSLVEDIRDHPDQIRLSVGLAEQRQAFGQFRHV